MIFTVSSMPQHYHTLSQTHIIQFGIAVKFESAILLPCVHVLRLPISHAVSWRWHKYDSAVSTATCSVQKGWEELQCEHKVAKVVRLLEQSWPWQWWDKCNNYIIIFYSCNSCWPMYSDSIFLLLFKSLHWVKKISSSEGKLEVRMVQPWLTVDI